MNIQPPFAISILMSFVAFGVVTKVYLWPWLRTRGRNEALLALVVPHLFRFVGLSFLVPGVVSPELPRAIAVPAAYGDLGAAILALIATRTLGAAFFIPTAIVPPLRITHALVFRLLVGKDAAGP